MSNRSATERIAVELLGWKRVGGDWHIRPEHVKETRKRAGIAPEVVIVDDYGSKGGHDVFIAPDGGQIWVCGCDKTNTRWPDLTTLDGCREFEDALVANLDDWGYMCYLHDVRGTRDTETEAEAVLRATPEQRVAACLRVLDEVKR